MYNKQAVYQFSSANTITEIENYQLEGNTTVQTGSYINIKAVIGIKQGN